MKRFLLRTGWLALLPLFLVVGCQSNEDVTSYTVPKPPPPPAAEPGEPVRVLGAIIPTGGESWFFKLMAPPTAVAEHEKAFSQFIQSLKRGDKPDAPFTWKLPEGWKQLPGDGQFRFATLRFGPEDEPLNLSVSSSGGDLVANVDRWRGQIGLRPLGSEKALREQKAIADLTVGDLKLVLVDMTGPGVPKARRPGGMGVPVEKAPPERPTAIQYTTPEGWKAVRPKTMITYAAFRLPDSKSPVPEVTITPLAGRSGGLLENLNRWRGQIDLPPLTKMPEDLQTLAVPAIKEPCMYIDLSGPAGADQRRLLVVACKNGDTTWFFKLQAPVDLAAKQKGAFEAFVKSVRFDAGSGAKP